MPVRAWDAGAQNVALGIMYLLLFVFMISLGITQSNWRWNFQTIFGLVFLAAFFIHGYLVLYIDSNIGLGLVSWNRSITSKMAGEWQSRGLEWNRLTTKVGRPIC